ncbi:MAG: hypothetical protein JXA41_01125 [Deltaproteobacteria bacterium]|nr:hypothetical protein [Deltaproteobacteria bacterium]
MIISSHLSKTIASNQASLKPSYLSANLKLSVGENIEAVVLGYDRQYKVLLRIKNGILKAHSQLELHKDDRLKLFVDQLRPSLILKITSHETSGTTKVNESLRMYRSNPDALKNLILTSSDLLRGDNLKILTPLIGEKDLQALTNVLNKLIITKDNLTDPFFLKHYVESLGLTLEKTLRKALSDPTVLKDDRLTDNLKRLLLKIELTLRDMPIIHNGAETGAEQKLKPFLQFMESGGKVIEHLQIVNCTAMEQDQLFVLQIPFQYPDGIRMQDIFIEKDGYGNSQDGEEQYRIVLFLDMDALGEIACDVRIRQKELSCLIKSNDPFICNFISSLLAELREHLSAAGYECRSLKCFCDRQMASWKQDIIHKYNLFSGNTVNLSI